MPVAYNTLLEDAKCYTCLGIPIQESLTLGLLSTIYSSSALCGLATTQIAVTGASVPAANQTYTRVSATRYNAADGIWRIEFTGGIWKMFRNSAIPYILPSGNPFPCGVWEPNEAAAPVPLADWV
jgi:hypothetical protein